MVSTTNCSKESRSIVLLNYLLLERDETSSSSFCRTCPSGRQHTLRRTYLDDMADRRFSVKMGDKKPVQKFVYVRRPDLLRDTET